MSKWCYRSLPAVLKEHIAFNFNKGFCATPPQARHWLVTCDGDRDRYRDRQFCLWRGFSKSAFHPLHSIRHSAFASSTILRLSLILCKNLLHGVGYLCEEAGRKAYKYATTTDNGQPSRKDNYTVNKYHHHKLEPQLHYNTRPVEYKHASRKLSKVQQARIAQLATSLHTAKPGWLVDRRSATAVPHVNDILRICAGSYGSSLLRFRWSALGYWDHSQDKHYCFQSRRCSSVLKSLKLICLSLVTQSFAGSLIMIIPFILSKQLRKIRHRLILGMAVNDALQALAVSFYQFDGSANAEALSSQVLIPSVWSTSHGTIKANSPGCNADSFFYLTHVVAGCFWTLA
jgi:hypothetical protein